MTRWRKADFKSSIAGLAGRPNPPSDSVLQEGSEDIRDAMLLTLGDDGARRFVSTTRRIRYATDIKDLWYLRTDLMSALAAVHGERAARERIAAINAQLQGLLHGGLNSRPSPLS